MGQCHTDQGLHRQAAWYLPVRVQFLLRNDGIIVLAVMNAYVAQGLEMVLECIRLEPLEKPVVNLHSHVKRMLHDTRLLTNTFFFTFFLGLME